jgi:transcriptional regulator with XRE-family HTH domain
MRRHPINDELRAILIEARKAKGLTQTALAKQLGRPQAMVSNYERGQRRLDVGEFIEIARLLGLDPASLIAKLEDSQG